MIIFGGHRLLEDTIQSIDVDWLDQMRDETCILCASEIFIHSITAERNAAQAVVTRELIHEVDAIAIGQSDVGDDEVELLIRGKVARRFYRARSHDIVALLAEYSPEHFQGCLIILHQQESISRARM